MNQNPSQESSPTPPPPRAVSRLLLVDDDPPLLRLLSIRLRRAGYEVEALPSGQQALQAMARNPADMVVTDLKMDGMDGLQLLSELKHRYPDVPVQLLTAHGTIPDAVLATRCGASGFLTKPVDVQELLGAIEDAIHRPATAFDRPTAARPPEDWRRNIVTQNPAMEALLAEAALAGKTHASILIQSESGTGKELLARAIHEASPRASAPFVTVNCSAIPESLFESEMFGHVKGSFTGAHADRPGLFREAHGGTLFLDEIGDMPPSFQAKLLRALQDQAIRPVGSDQSISVDARIISATHQDLESQVKARLFREDLYYRLNVINLELPPLRERREDIPLLVRHFLDLFADDGVATQFNPAALERLVSHRWPGNVRQLANVVQHCKVLCRSTAIPLSLVEHALRGRQPPPVSLAQARDAFERSYLTSLLKATDGNVSQAARLAERNRSEFYKLLKKHELDPAAFRDGD